jgi:4-carboxymuconolactone decarboxylase
MNDSQRRRRGRQTFEEVMGFPLPDAQGPFVDATVDHLFADVWTRGGLSRRERRLVSLTTIACLGNESVLKLHLGAAMRDGVSDSDLDEWVLHLAHYAGWPVAAVAHNVARQLRAAGASDR